MARGHRKGIPLEHLMHGMWQEVWATLEGNQTGMWQVMGPPGREQERGHPPPPSGV